MGNYFIFLFNCHHMVHKQNSVKYDKNCNQKVPGSNHLPLTGDLNHLSWTKKNIAFSSMCTGVSHLTWYLQSTVSEQHGAKLAAIVIRFRCKKAFKKSIICSFN